MDLACAYMCDAGNSFTIGEVDIERLDVREFVAGCSIENT